MWIPDFLITLWLVNVQIKDILSRILTNIIPIKDIFDLTHLKDTLIIFLDVSKLDITSRNVVTDIPNWSYE